MDQKDQSEKEILLILSKIPLSSKEIEIKLSKDKICPDDTIRLLNRLRKKGIVSGCLNRELGEWFWWLKD
jgi:predicted transcriptional regulator